MSAIKLLDKAIAAMSKLHAAVSPDPYEEDAILPAAALREFVDAHAELLFERTRIDALLATGGWIPIESAPKDEVPILIRAGNGSVYVVTYDALFSAPWRIRNDQGINEKIPTHWQPLPPLPEANK